MIINPFIIYLIGISEGVKIASEIIAALTLVSGVFIIVFASSEYEADGDNKKYKKYGKNLIICGVISAIVALMIPHKDTLALMYISKFVTVENVNTSVEVIKSATDYVINAINSIK